MKPFPTCMAIIVLLLSLLPCSDHGIEAHDHQAHTGPSMTNENHSEHDDEAESCSPFCHCTCCHTNVTFLKVAFEPLIAQVAATQYPAFQDQLAGAHQYSIWQPPNA